MLAAAVLAAVVRSGPAARRRVVVLAAPVVTAAVLVQATFGGFLASSWQFTHPVLLTAPQWAALGLVPVLTLARPGHAGPLRADAPPDLARRRRQRPRRRPS